MAGSRASLRNLRRLCHRQLSQIDDQSITALAEARRATANAQYPEWAMMVLVNRARETEAATGVPWPRALVSLVDARRKPNTTTEEGR